MTVTASKRPLLLELRGVSKAYGSVRALEGVDFHVAAGEVVALVGDNGAGKTTLVKIITGAHQADDGDISFDGAAYSLDSPSAARELGIEVVYQNLALAENLSIAANVFLGREIRKRVLGVPTPFFDARAMNAKTLELLKRYNVAIDSPKRSVAKLSGGQRQLVAIARGASWGSRLLVMDEPTAALGIQETRKVLDLIRPLREHGVAVVIVSHNLDQVFEVSDRIVVMRRGRVAGTVRTSESNASEVVHLITGANVIAQTGTAGVGRARTAVKEVPHSTSQRRNG